MAGNDRMVCHFPERVLRQYMYVQRIRRPPTGIELIAADDVVMPSWSLLYMSSAISRGVSRFRITSRGLILEAT